MSPPDLGLGDVLGGVRREIERNAARARNGIKYAAGGQFAPIGPTPSEVIWRVSKTELRHYPGEQPATRQPPVVIVGGLVGRSYIFDLVDNNSFVRRVMSAGFETFVLDWGEPGADDCATSLDTYLLDYFPRAIDAAREQTGAEQVNLIGYCMGGTLSLHGLAAQPELPVRNLAVMAAPIDFAHLSEFVNAIADGRLDIDAVFDETGNVPPDLIANFFRIRKPTADVVNYANLWQNLWNDDYMEAYQALGRCFNDHVPLAGAAFRQIAETWMRDNAFVSGCLRLGGKRVSLGAIEIPVLIVLATRDDLVPEASAAPLVDLLTGTEPDFLPLDTGHASLVSGRTAAKVTVPQILQWLADRSEEITDASS